MDVLAVKQGVKWARDWTLSGKGPIVLELVTYRYGGHSMSDPGTTYRTREEIQHMRSANDPITGLRSRILDLGFLNDTELKVCYTGVILNTILLQDQILQALCHY